MNESGWTIRTSEASRSTSVSRSSVNGASNVDMSPSADAVIRGRSAFEWWGDRGDATLTKRRIAPRRGRGHDSTVTEPINGNQQVRLSGHAGTCTWPL